MFSFFPEPVEKSAKKVYCLTTYYFIPNKSSRPTERVPVTRRFLTGIPTFKRMENMTLE